MLEVKSLRKEYGPLTAVKGVSFSLNPGDIFGFIGSNGAGKTTTIKMIATLLEPTSGTAVLNGADILGDPMEVRRQIGYMPDFFGLYDEVRVWEYLDFFAALYRVPSVDRPGIIDNVLELTDLTVKKGAFVQSLSRGMQQRLCLARCLVHDPALLLLDEPASGLDPRARAELKELIAELGRMGKIVIVSSHILPELADFCNSVGIIERGELLACGPVEDIIQSLQTARCLMLKSLSDPVELAAFIERLPLVQSARSHDATSVAVEFLGGLEEQADLLDAVIRQGYRVVGYSEELVDLEDVFLRLTTGAVN
ncbi:MAG TPA: ABC transporter ATP-binding protein [Fimbriimonadaceae bacterium]|nr:ABC transporter ATP-binding protein [Fimbriimonadaceae bacterium]